MNKETKTILDLFCRKDSIALTNSKLFEHNDYCILGVNLDFKHLLNIDIKGDIDLLYIPIKLPLNYHELMLCNKQIEVIPEYNRAIANEIKTQFINLEDEIKSKKYNTSNKLNAIIKQTIKLYDLGFLNSNLIFINSNETENEISGVETWFLESERVDLILNDMISSKELTTKLRTEYFVSIYAYNIAILKDRDINLSSTFSEEILYINDSKLSNNFITNKLKNILIEKINPILPNEINSWKLPLIIRMCNGKKSNSRKEKHLYINTQSEKTNCPICNSSPN